MIILLEIFLQLNASILYVIYILALLFLLRNFIVVIIRFYLYSFIHTEKKWNEIKEKNKYSSFGFIKKKKKKYKERSRLIKCDQTTYKMHIPFLSFKAINPCKKRVILFRYLI